jgi:hypothetical protein
MGAVRFAVGAEGSTYQAQDGTEYQLTGWTFDAIGQHERYLEQRAVDAINRLKLTPEQRSQAYAALMERIACFCLSYGTEVFDKSLSGLDGMAHFFWQLAKPHHPELALAKAQEMARADGVGLLEAVYLANPRNRATAEPLKTA